MVSFFAAQVDLVLQISIFVFLVAGFAVERKREVKAHANLMLVAVVLNLISFVAIMAPAWDNVGEGGIGSLSTIGMLHVTFGSLTMLSSLWVLGTWIVPTFLLQNSKLRCYGKFNKSIMWVVLSLWLVSLIMGFVLYIMVNTTWLGSFPVGFSGN